VGLAVHRRRRFLAGGVDQAEDLAGTLVVPVPDVVDAILALCLGSFLCALAAISGVNPSIRLCTSR
jgi:hypothetical protein